MRSAQLLDTRPLPYASGARTGLAPFFGEVPIPHLVAISTTYLLRVAPEAKQIADPLIVRQQTVSNTTPKIAQSTSQSKPLWQGTFSTVRIATREHLSREACPMNQTVSARSSQPAASAAKTMIEMFVVNVGLDAYTGTPILLLTDSEKRRLLPIWIGIHEAGAIQRAQYGIKSPRPMTHDLLLDVILETGNNIDHVEITGLDDGRYLAAMVLSHSGEIPISVVLDARPSDAVAVALLANAPILVSLPVVAEATVPAEPEREQSETEEFKKFVSGLNASDFKLQGQKESGPSE